MIYFFDISGCQTDLVTVRRIAMGCLTHQFLLWEFAFHGILDGYGRICSTGHTHSLIYISTSGKRITDSTTQTGSRTTKWLDLGRMVVGLIFEIDKPFFCLAVNLYRHNDRACIDLVRFFLIVQLAVLF